MEQGIPFLPMPLMANTGVNLEQQRHAPTTHWRIDNFVVNRETGKMSHYDPQVRNSEEMSVGGSLVFFFFDPKNVPTQEGWLQAFGINLEEVGKVYLQPVFVGEKPNPMNHEKFLIFDAMTNVFGATPILAELHEKFQAQNQNFQKQDGMWVLYPEYLTRCVQVAQMIVMQRWLGNQPK